MRQQNIVVVIVIVVVVVVVVVCICLTLNAYPSFLLHEINFCCRGLGKLVVLEHDSRLLSNFTFAHAPPLAYPLTIVSTPLFNEHINGQDLYVG